MWKYLVPAVLLVSGCAAQVKSSSERTVVIWAPGDQLAEAQKLADEECSKHQRRARLSGPIGGAKYVYDCER